MGLRNGMDIKVRRLSHHYHPSGYVVVIPSVVVPSVTPFRDSSQSTPYLLHSNGLCDLICLRHA